MVMLGHLSHWHDCWSGFVHVNNQGEYMLKFWKFILLCLPIVALAGAAFFALNHIAESWSSWVAIPALVGMFVYALILVEWDCNMISDMAKEPTVAPFLFTLGFLLLGLLIWGICSM